MHCKTEINVSLSALAHLNQHLRTCTAMHPHAATCSHMQPHATACTHMHPHAPTCTHSLLHAPTFTHMHTHVAMLLHSPTCTQFHPHATTRTNFTLGRIMTASPRLAIRQTSPCPCERTNNHTRAVTRTSPRSITIGCAALRILLTRGENFCFDNTTAAWLPPTSAAAAE